MSLRWSLLLLLAALAVGFVLGRQTVPERARSERSDRQPPARQAELEVTSDQSQAEPARAASVGDPVVVDEALTVPPEQRPDTAIYLPVEWDGERFVHWYRSHARTNKLMPRDPRVLRSFGAEVLEMLGRIPRREILDELMAAYSTLHDARVAVEAAEEAGEIASHEVEARLAPARRTYSDRLYHALSYADYRFLTREWVDHRNPYRHFRHAREPTTPRPNGGDPYAIPLRSSEDFAAWYDAYRHDLDLPARDDEFLGSFFNDIVRPLGRAPQPELMRKLQALYLAYDDPDGADAAAVRALFHGLKSVLEPIDYDRIRWWNDWPGTLEELGLLEGH